MTMSRSPSPSKTCHSTFCLAAQSIQPIQLARYTQSTRTLVRSSVRVLMVGALLSALLGCDNAAEQTTDKDINSINAVGQTSTVASTATDHANNNINNNITKNATDNTTNHATVSESNVSETVNQNALSKATAEKPLHIDWSQVDSKVSAVDADTFNYPFALNSKNVKSYADFFKVTPQQAQYNLTVGTASNEPLTHLLDQLGNQYLSHELTDGKEIKLIVHTTANVAPSHYDYVIADDFARGLILPIEILPTPNNVKAAPSD